MGIEKTIDQNHPDVLRERIANLEQALTESKNETAACLKFLQNRLSWEDFWTEFKASAEDKSSAERNCRLLADFLQQTNHGIRYHEQHEAELATLRQEKAALEQQVAALTKPVTDEEWQWSYWQEDGGMRSFVNAFIKARSSRVAGSRDAARSRSEDGQDESPSGDAVTSSLLRTDDPARGSRTAGSSKDVVNDDRA